MCLYQENVLATFRNFLRRKKLADCTAYLFYNRIYKKPKIFIYGTKTHLYELKKKDEMKKKCYYTA